MRPTRFGAAATVTVCGLAVLTAFAQPGQSLPFAPQAKADKAIIDKPVTDFKLPDLTHEKKEGDTPDAATLKLSDYRGKKPVVLFFMSEQCSVTWRYEKRFGQLMQKFGKDVAILGVRCSANDTPKSICKFAESKNFAVPVLNDEKGVMTAYFNVHNTPSFVVIDKKGVLRYFGSFDNAADEPDVTKRYLPDALSAVMADKVVVVKETRPFG